MRVAGHHPTRVTARLGGERLDQLRNRGRQLRRGNPAVQPQVQRDLVVARSPGVQGGAGGRDFGEPSLDGGVDVFVRVFEIEGSRIELALDPTQAALDRRELGFGKKARGGQPARVSEAAGDIKRIQLEVDLERRRESLKLKQQRAPKAGAPELAYGVSLFTSPSRLPSSRACSWPWTRAEVRTPMPHSLMKPAA